MKIFPDRNYIIKFKKPRGEERAVDDLLSTILSEAQSHSWNGWVAFSTLSLWTTESQATSTGTDSWTPYTTPWVRDQTWPGSQNEHGTGQYLESSWSTKPTGTLPLHLNPSLCLQKQSGSTTDLESLESLFYFNIKSVTSGKLLGLSQTVFSPIK